MLSGKEDKEVEEDLSWSHKSLDGVFRSFIGSSGVRVHYLGPQYVSPIFLFFVFFFEKNRSIKTKKKKHTETAITHSIYLDYIRRTLGNFFNPDQLRDNLDGIAGQGVSKPSLPPSLCDEIHSFPWSLTRSSRPQ